MYACFHLHVRITGVKHVMIATGGTGGHIYPALAFADELVRRDPSCHVSFIGSSNRMEAQLIPAQGYDFTGFEMTGMNGGISAKIRSAVSLKKAEGKITKMLKENRPDACVGFGNYISVPLIMAAHRLHIPTMISEQNSFAGKANVMLGRYADAIEIAYANSAKDFPKEKTRLLGNPDATRAWNRKVEPDFVRQYGLEPGQPYVVIMMGSLGSESVSRVLDEACALLDGDYPVVIAKGKANDYTFENKRDFVHLVDYVDGIACLRTASAAVCRAGATTLAEIAVCGCASILIPSPFVPNNHQVYNAMELVSRDAAWMIEEKDLTAEKLVSGMNRLMRDDACRSRMKANASAMGTKDAAGQMVSWLEDIVNG